MSEAKFATGPWVSGAEVQQMDMGETIMIKAERPNGREFIASVLNFDDFPCLELEESDCEAIDEECRANARLIAAAPELLAAVEAVEVHWSGGNFSRDAVLWRQLRAAIAKAKGAERQAK